MTGPCLELPAEWRSRADLLRRFGSDAQAARIWEIAAEELEQAAAQSDAEVLTIKEAAKLSGYSEDHLRRLVRDGKIPNAGRPNAPRVRRRDLPMCALPASSQAAEPVCTEGVGKVQIARSIVNLNG